MKKIRIVSGQEYNQFVLKFIYNLIIVIFLSIAVAPAWAIDESDESMSMDEGLASSLKIEAYHDQERLKNYDKEISNNKIFEAEREKALGEFLDEQEQWDLNNERALKAYQKQKKATVSKESGPEYQSYLNEVRANRIKNEKMRQAHVNTRNKILNLKSKELTKLEVKELDVYLLRPRFDINKRLRNKWIASGQKQGGGGSVGSSQNSNTNYSPNISDTSSPAVDYPQAPLPYEGFDELPPVPQQYDSNYNNGVVPYDPSFSDGGMSVPPPPPPPPDYDF